MAAARAAATSWAEKPLHRRLEVVRNLRRRLGVEPELLAATADLPWRISSAETLTAEVLPLLDACRFLERAAPEILKPRRPRRRRRPAWLMGSKLEIRREALGVVLVIGPSNYPILLAGVQVVQALAAGNAVVVKPGRGGAPAMRCLEQALTDAGLPKDVLQVLSESVGDAEAAIDAGVDKVVLTGGVATGSAVLTRLAGRPTPAVVELSGCDAVIVRDDADLDLAARAIAFGMQLNGGFTCIAPRRLLVADSVLAELERRLWRRLSAVPPIALPDGAQRRLEKLLDEAEERGGRMAFGRRPRLGACAPILLADTPHETVTALADVAAPVAAVFPVAGDAEALRTVASCPYRLGVSIFGSPAGARALARRVDAGVAVVNDMIVPTADPRVPFGGRGASGFGVTRGAEGLLELTTLKTVAVRSGSFRPHFDPVAADDAPLFAAFVQTVHGSSLGRRWRAMLRLMAEGRVRMRRQR